MYYNKIVYVLLFCLSFTLMINAKVDSSTILAKVDDYRGYHQRFQFEINITDYDDGNKSGETSLYVYVKN